MKSSKPISGRYLGYREADRATPYARFFNPELAPLASHVCAALDRGGVPIDLLPPEFRPKASPAEAADAIFNQLRADGIVG